MVRYLLVVSLFSAAVAMAQLAPESPAELSARFVKLMIGNKPTEAAALFSEKILAQNPVIAITSAWTQAVGPLGAYKKTVDVTRKPMGDNEVFVHRVEFELGAIMTYATVNTRQVKVEGFQIKPVLKDFVSADYVKSDAFVAKDVAFGSRNFPLPATVLSPVGKGPFPAVVLVHGSGPNDRDETIGANKPFRDLAEGLASRGIVVFRYDKRTFVHGAKMANATIATEVMDDALAAIEVVRKYPGVDPRRVVMIGHSLGALLAPQLAAVAKVAGVVLLAPPARSPYQILPQQYRYLGVPEAEVVAMENKLFAIRDGKSQDAVMGASAAYWRDWAGRDGILAANALAIPILVMRGDRDYQVIAEDFAAWKKGLPKAKFVEVAGANHLFITGVGKPGPAEYDVPSHVAIGVVTTIATFVSAVQAQ